MKTFRKRNITVSAAGPVKVSRCESLMSGNFSRRIFRALFMLFLDPKKRQF